MSRYADMEWLLGVAKLSNGTVDIDDIYNAPSINIVCCRECKKAHLTADGTCKYCEEWKDDDGNYIEVYHDGDHFCSDGERKDNWLFQNWILRSSAEPYAGEVFTIELPEEEKTERNE